MSSLNLTAALIIEGSEGFNLTVEIDEMSPLYVLRTLFKQAGIRRVLVSDSVNGKDIAKTSTKLGLDFVLDKRIKVQSPEGCVLAGLDYLPERYKRLFIVPADFPLFETKTIIQLCENEAEIVVPLYKGKRGYPVLIKRSMFAELQAHNGDLKSFLEANNDCVTEIETSDMGVTACISDASKQNELVSRHSLYTKLRPDDRIYVANKQSYFGPGLRQLIMLVDEQKSVNAARVIMGMAATRAAQIVAEAEKTLGFKLFDYQGG
jgi:CTP:molybdopterin cytidylyltransferase MocA